MTKEDIKRLDEAAEEYAIREGYLAGLHHNSMVQAFKSGVKWRDSQFPILLDNLNNAARLFAIPHYTKDIDENYIEEYPYDTGLEIAFKAGAKWNAEQGETVEGKIIDFVDGRIDVEFDVDSKLRRGDKVIVQIRKKH